MTPQEEAIVRAIFEREEKDDIQRKRAGIASDREKFSAARMKFLDMFMGMPPDAPHVPPANPMTTLPPMPPTTPRLQDVVNPAPVKSPSPYQPVVPIIGVRG